MKRLSLSLTYVACAVIILSASVFALALNFPSAFALSGSDWRAGNIISDTNFYDSSQMSALDIQRWLDANLSCDTDGVKISEHRGGVDYNGDGKVTRAEWARAVYGYTGKFVCLRDYQENPATKQNNLVTGATPAGAISAAEIIKRASDTYQVNPKVLLVKIRKESPGPLSSDEWPLPSQFDAAMGYACPDPPAGQPVVCDPAYKGFYNQIHNAARQLRNYVTNSSRFRYKPYQNNTILYNPNSACGTSSVYIENYATAGLYNYTPYQPNKAALDNLYGEGDACSAYGNRNFWTMYTSMFGATVSPQVGNKPASASAYAKASCVIPAFTADYVGRLYNPDVKNYLFTTSRVEACLAVSYGYMWDGVVFKDAKGKSDAVPVYRIANYERHVFTTSLSVRNDYIASRGYHDEGIAFYVSTTPGENKIPVYGLQRDQTFWFTSAAKEGEVAGAEGYYNFGVIFYTDNLAPSPIPLYRLTNRYHIRMYTPSEIERRLAKENYGFVDEGVITYNDSYPNQANSPVYRLRSPWGTYFYTNSRHERDIAVINYGYYNEGIGFYALLYGTPAYRSLNPQNAQRFYTNSSLEYNLSSTSYGYLLEGVGWYGY